MVKIWPLAIDIQHRAHTRTLVSGAASLRRAKKEKIRARAHTQRQSKESREVRDGDGGKKAAVVVIMLFKYNLKIIGDLNSIQGLSTSSSFEPRTHTRNRYMYNVSTEYTNSLDSIHLTSADFSTISHVIVSICIAICTQHRYE